MKNPPRRSAFRPSQLLRAGLLAAAALCAAQAQADEGGMGFWLPGQIGTFAAVQNDPGWSWTFSGYHAYADSATRNQNKKGRVTNAQLSTPNDLLFIAPTYTFATPVAGAQAAISLTGLYGRTEVYANAATTTPKGKTRSDSSDDTRSGIGDLYPMATLKWNFGKHNYLAYATVGAPTGDYDVNRAANLGLNHWSYDAGGGYSYLDEKNGTEFSAVLGLTFNQKNPDTDYRNGTDAHLDISLSQFLNEDFHIGLVGYAYHQLENDDAPGLGKKNLKSQVAGLGPQAGYFFKVGQHKWYANLKAYDEFDAKNRTAGWNAWLSLFVPL
ncbi:SphA family protein [Chromobacterium alticapitis]|uniref:Phenol degradation protein n=1 Tax=Chromobacterium alticapitis TaxID=2073169 RepID=A0A2S5DG55_9NEIS|nr:transporter [Chromobacterium alticapitis]POZ61972.1 phenol degradation protein [Chromobacterium alticapitis]